MEEQAKHKINNIKIKVRVRIKSSSPAPSKGPEIN
jgi:hypothetical protein